MCSILQDCEHRGHRYSGEIGRKRTPDALEDEENQDKANDSKKEERSGNHGAAEEKKVYDPLVCSNLCYFFFLALTLPRRCTCSAT